MCIVCTLYCVYALLLSVAAPPPFCSPDQYWFAYSTWSPCGEWCAPVRINTWSTHSSLPLPLSLSLPPLSPLSLTHPLPLSLSLLSPPSPCLSLSLSLPPLSPPLPPPSLLSPLSLSPVNVCNVYGGCCDEEKHYSLDMRPDTYDHFCAFSVRFSNDSNELVTA